MDHRRGSDGQAAATAGAESRDNKDRDKGVLGSLEGLRASDIEPYTGLRYLSKLFRFMAVVLVLVLVAEVATGLYTQGAASIPTLLGEASRLIVLAGVLWGTGDLAHLLIDVGHDVRAGRILLARSAAGGAAFMPRDRAAQDRSYRDGLMKGGDVAIADRSALNATSSFADQPVSPKSPDL